MRIRRDIYLMRDVYTRAMTAVPTTAQGHGGEGKGPRLIRLIILRVLRKVGCMRWLDQGHDWFAHHEEKRASLAPRDTHMSYNT